MDRRVFLTTTGAAFASIGLGSRAARATAWGSPRTIRVPLVAAATKFELSPGKPCTVFAYNGQLPGPVIEAREGDRVVIDFHNALDEPSTIHWHGLHLPFEADGSPFHPVPPGGDFRYEYTLQPGSAGTYWYHPHPHHRTGHQVGHGLHGAFIVRAPDDPLEGMPEQVMLLWDNRVNEAGTVDLHERHTPRGVIDFENGREGDLHFVNAKLQQTLPIRSGEVQRWRIINASAARYYRLALEGHTLLHVGSDGGLFEHPVEVPELLLAPAERVEVLVRATGAPGTRARLVALPYDRYIPQTRPANWRDPCPLLTLAYSTEPPITPRPLPAVLRHVPPLDPAAATATRVMSLSQGMINGKIMDPDRIDVTAPLGATEIWEVENLVGMDHPFHLHGFQFQVLDRNGVPEPFRCWKDMVNVPKHSQARFIVRYDDFPGKWMFHCHILDHEDHGMMGILEVR
jgi:FtsP/CotA-like multicopper oxidase with cupredoxin domain